MHVTGALALFVGVGILLVVGMAALDSLHSEVNATNDSGLQAQNSMAQGIESPVLMIFGYGLLIVAAIALVNSFGSM